MTEAEEIRDLINSEDLDHIKREKLKEEILPTVALHGQPKKTKGNGSIFLPSSVENLKKNLGESNYSLFKQLFTPYLKKSKVNVSYRTGNNTYNHRCSPSAETNLEFSKPLRNVALDLLEKKEDLDEAKENLKDFRKVKDLFKLLKAKYYLEKAKREGYFAENKDEFNEEVSTVLGFLDDNTVNKISKKVGSKGWLKLLPDELYSKAYYHSFNSQSCSRVKRFLVKRDAAEKMYNMISNLEPEEKIRNSFINFQNEFQPLLYRLSFLKLIKKKNEKNESVYISKIKDVYKETIKDLEEEGIVLAVDDRVIVEPNLEPGLNDRIKKLERKEEKAIEEWLETDFGEIRAKEDFSSSEKTKIEKEKPFTNRRKLRDRLRSCKGEIKWLDKHFPKKGLEFLSRLVDDLKNSCSEIKILTGAGYKNDHVDHKMRKDFKKLKEEMNNEDIEISFRVLEKSKLTDLHDRWIISKNHKWNVPPLNSILANQEAEIIETDSEISFEERWEEGDDILKDWNEIQKYINQS